MKTIKRLKQFAAVHMNSIRLKTLLLIMMLVMIEFIIVSMLVSTTYRNSNIKKAHEDNTRAITNISALLNSERLMVDDFMVDIHSDSTIQQSMQQLCADGEMSAAQRMEAMERIKTRIASYASVNQDIVTAVMHMENGLRLSTSNALSFILDWNEFDAKYKQHVMEEPGELLAYVSSTNNQLVFARAQPLTVNGEKQYYIVAVLLNQERVNRALRQNMVDHSRKAILYSADGLICFRTGYDISKLTLEEFGFEDESGICSNSVGKWVYDSREIENYGMTLVTMANMNTIDFTTSAFLSSIQIACVCLIVLEILIAILITRWINRPIGQLRAQFHEILSTGKRKPLKIKGSTELMQVADNINDVLEKQEALIRDNYHTKILEKNARIQLLQIQINPHFVFNTLDIINWLIYTGKSAQAREMVTILGDMLRYSTCHYESLVTFEDELTHVRNYLRVQQLRYDDAFRVREDIDPETLRCRIPCLLVQPIVENAVKYGLSKQKSEGMLEISAVLQGGDLYISVFDNGKGISHEQIDQILSGNSKGIGLRNVNERLQLLYGEDYCMKIESEENYYTRITIHMPVRGEGHEDNRS